MTPRQGYFQTLSNRKALADHANRRLFLRAPWHQRLKRWLQLFGAWK